MSAVRVRNKAKSWVCIDSLVRNVSPGGSFVMDEDDARKNPDVSRCLGMGLLALEPIKETAPPEPEKREQPLEAKPKEANKAVEAGVPSFVSEESIAPQKEEIDLNAPKPVPKPAPKPAKPEIAVIATDRGKTMMTKAGSVTNAPLPAFIEDDSMAPQDDDDEDYSSAFVDREENVLKAELDKETESAFIENDMEEAANEQVVVEEEEK